jgi:hypothetical protein
MICPSCAVKLKTYAHKINFEYVFPEKELRALRLNFHIDLSVSYLYFPTIGAPIFLQQIGRPILGIYKSLTET